MNSYHYLPVQIDEIGKNLDKSINETSVSSISTDWSIQSISIKSDLPIFIDLSIAKLVPIVIDWLLRAYFKDVIQYYYCQFISPVLSTIEISQIHFILVYASAE